MGECTTPLCDELDNIVSLLCL